MARTQMKLSSGTGAEEQELAKPKKPRGPSYVYVIYKENGEPTSVVRKAEALAEALDADRDIKFRRLVIS